MKGMLRNLPWLVSTSTWLCQAKLNSRILQFWWQKEDLLFSRINHTGLFMHFNLVIPLGLFHMCSFFWSNLSSMLLISSPGSTGTLSHKSSPLFTPAYLLLFFNAVFCFFFHYKSNTISLEVYGNQTHYHIYKYFQSVSSCFPQGPMQIGVISKAGPEVEIFERVSGDGLSWGRKEGGEEKAQLSWLESQSRTFLVVIVVGELRKTKEMVSGCGRVQDKYSEGNCGTGY